MSYYRSEIPIDNTKNNFCNYVNTIFIDNLINGTFGSEPPDKLIERFNCFNIGSDFLKDLLSSEKLSESVKQKLIIGQALYLGNGFLRHFI